MLWKQKSRMNDLQYKNDYKKALRNCSWGELKLLLKLVQEKNANEERIIKQILKERRKIETA